MKERIIEFLKAENKTSAQFAEEIGVQPSGISHIISGRNKPSLDFILKMFEKYEYLSTDWLLFGKGSMYKEPAMQKLFEESVDSDTNNSITPKEQSQKSETKNKTFTEAADRQLRKELSVEKIVWFFNDRSFREYFPGNDQVIFKESLKD